MQTPGQFGTANSNHRLDSVTRPLVERSQRIQAGSRSYDVQLTINHIDAASDTLREAVGSRKALVVTTPTVAALYGNEIYHALHHHNDRASFLVLDCDEASKSLEQVTRVCRKAVEVGLDRKGLLIGIGGGVCLDIVTVAASWIRRGVGHIRVPTTLIGQIDAGIGIKGAVNFGGKKNYLGCFYAPETVLVTPSFLSTLTRNHISEGFAEIIKIALVRDAWLFELAEKLGPELLSNKFSECQHGGKEVLWRSILGMLSELEPNIYEDQSYERLVDFGHTFSPGLEAASSFEITHGEAVSVDIAVSTVLSTRIGLLSADLRDRILSLLITLELPVWTDLLTAERCEHGLRDCALHRGGRPNLVLPTAIGQAVFVKESGAVSLHLEQSLQFLNELNCRMGGQNVPVCEAKPLAQAAEA